MPYQVISDLSSSMYQIILMNDDTEELETFSLWLEFNTIPHHHDHHDGHLFVRTFWLKDTRQLKLLKDWINSRPGESWPG